MKSFKIHFFLFCSIFCIQDLVCQGAKDGLRNDLEAKVKGGIEILRKLAVGEWSEIATQEQKRKYDAALETIPELKRIRTELDDIKFLESGEFEKISGYKKDFRKEGDEKGKEKFRVFVQKFGFKDQTDFVRPLTKKVYERLHSKEFENTIKKEKDSLKVETFKATDSGVIKRRVQTAIVTLENLFKDSLSNLERLQKDFEKEAKKATELGSLKKKISEQRSIEGFFSPEKIAEYIKKSEGLKFLEAKQEELDKLSDEITKTKRGIDSKAKSELVRLANLDSGLESVIKERFKIKNVEDIRIADLSRVFWLDEMGKYAESPGFAALRGSRMLSELVAAEQGIGEKFGLKIRRMSKTLGLLDESFKLVKQLWRQEYEKRVVHKVELVSDVGFSVEVKSLKKILKSAMKKPGTPKKPRVGLKPEQRNPVNLEAQFLTQIKEMKYSFALPTLEALARKSTKRVFYLLGFGPTSRTVLPTTKFIPGRGKLQIPFEKFNRFQVGKILESFAGAGLWKLDGKYVSPAEIALGDIRKIGKFKDLKLSVEMQKQIQKIKKQEQEGKRKTEEAAEKAITQKTERHKKPLAEEIAQKTQKLNWLQKFGERVKKATGDFVTEVQLGLGFGKAYREEGIALKKQQKQRAAVKKIYSSRKKATRKQKLK
ncbi:hypothetical protein KAU11_02595 [Candidatus Babeliales bacterium]|nr:hypothetical protein [Candidatus Babeliales bacterium]